MLRTLSKILGVLALLSILQAAPQPAEAREAAAVVPAAAATSVTSAASTVPAAAATSDSGQAVGLSASNNQFAFELLQQLHKANPQENIIYSPFSVSTALSMTYAGARANTAGQMAATLHFGPNEALFHNQFQALLTQLESGSKPYTLHLANAVWLQHNYPLEQSYRSLLDHFYQGSFQQVDFIRATEAARLTINHWVEDKTDREIKELLQDNDLSPNTRLVLTNAIYFKGLWALPFEPRATTKDTFKVTADQKVTVDMMNQAGVFKAAAHEDGDLLELPYTGEELALVILLPKDQPGALEKCLTNGQLQTLLDRAAPKKIEVYLPKFKADARYYLDQEKYLPALGMTDAFNPKAADFSGMTGYKNLFIAHVIHQAMLEVDEAGSKAAAATAVVMNTKSASRPQVFRVDRPFIVALYYKPARTILFLGRINNPAA